MTMLKCTAHTAHIILVAEKEAAYDSCMRKFGWAVTQAPEGTTHSQTPDWPMIVVPCVLPSTDHTEAMARDACIKQGGRLAR